MEFLRRCDVQDDPCKIGGLTSFRVRKLFFLNRIRDHKMSYLSFHLSKLPFVSFLPIIGDLGMHSLDRYVFLPTPTVAILNTINEAWVYPIP